MLRRKLMFWPIVIYVIAQLTGCAVNRESSPTDRASVCSILPEPFHFQSVDEIKATPRRPLEYIENYSEAYYNFCQ